MGNLFHQSIDLCFQAIQSRKLDWKGITEAERKALVRGMCGAGDRPVWEYHYGKLCRNAYLARRVERITDRTIWLWQSR